MRMLSRRRMLQFSVSLGCASYVALPGAAFAQKYPEKPIRLVSPYAPGGATDTIARLMGQWISDQLGVSVVVENRPGGGANIGTESVLRSPADGYTLLLASTANAVNATLFPKLGFNFINDVTPIGNIGNAFNILLAHPSLPAKTAAEFVAHLKANPGKVPIGLPGNGSPQHMSAVLFKEMTETQPLFVQYRGGSMVLNDLAGNHVPVGVASSIASAELVRNGTLRALGVTIGKRSAAFPDIPSLAEAVPGYEAINFYGLVAPKGTPANIIETLNRALNAGLADPALSKRLEALGIVLQPTTPDEFKKIIVGETEKWAKVVKAADLKPQ
jgi:tripartite-type tricarboxylate transporter receptor subunit TctC